MGKSTIPKGAATKLVAATKNVPKPLLPDTSSKFIRIILHYPDVAEGAKILAEQAGLQFDIKDGADIETLKLDQTELDKRYKSSLDRLNVLEAKRNASKEYIKSGSEGKREGFLHWKSIDQFSAILIYLVLIAVLIMGAANIYANLMASGTSIFIEQPWLAISLSMLMPAGSTALKFISGIFEHSKGKKRYALFIYVLATTLFCLWSIFFAQNFTGVAGEIDWDSFGEGDSGKGPILVWLQLATEIAVAGALFMAAEEIHHKYAPDHFIRSPEYIEAARVYEAHLKEHRILQEQRNTTHSKIIALEKSRQAFINEALAEFFALRSKLNAMNNF